MAAYYVKFRLTGEDVMGVCVAARSKAEAYDRAVFEEIPKAYGEMPYSAWVSSVTYQNGNSREFNTFEGNPY